MFRHKAYLLITLLLGFTFFLNLKCVQAEDLKLKNQIFERGLNYKIYFSGTEEYGNMIDGVQILGFEEIAGRLFLVVQEDGFSITRNKGYVLFDSISAILPGRELKINRVRKTSTTK